MEKRRSKEVKKFESDKVGYILFYFVQDQTHNVLSTNSLLLPPDFDYGKCKPKATVILRPETEARVIAKSYDRQDILLYEDQLTKRLDKSDELNVTIDSLRFLNDSMSSEKNERQPSSMNGEGKQVPPLTMETDSESYSSVIDDASGTPEISHASQTNTDASGSATTIALNLLTSQMSTYLARRASFEKKCLKYLKQISKEMKIMKESAVGNIKSKYQIDYTKLAPVMFGDTNLTIMGDRHLEPTVYGQLVARTLFTDEELEQKKLFSRRDSGRPHMSPNRSELLRAALMARFGDDDAFRDAVSSINQLGNDLKRGKRKRKQ